MDIALVLITLVVTILLFASDRFRLDLIALLSLLVLSLSGILTSSEALAGFADPLVIMIAGLFVVGEGIFRTGLADALGQRLERLAGNQPIRLLITVMLTTALLSAFLSSTGTVAVMLPVVMSMARRKHLSPSKLLIPLSFASLLGGMLTLIGTPPNLVVNNQLQGAGMAGFGFFEFFPVGVVMLVIGVLFMVTIGQRLLPDRQENGANGQSQLSSLQLARTYRLDQLVHSVRVSSASPLIGHSLGQLQLRGQYNITVLGIETHTPRGMHLRQAEVGSIIHEQEILYILGQKDDLDRFASDNGLESIGDNKLPTGMLSAEVIIPPRSSLLGQSLKVTRFHDRYNVTVLALRRGASLHQDLFREQALEIGDSLLITGTHRDLSRLRKERQDLIMVSEPEELQSQSLDMRKASRALLIMLGMLILMTFNIVPNVQAVLLAAVAMVVSACLSLPQAYRSINAESVVLIAAILPMATALETTGALALIIGGLEGALAAAGPYIILLTLFVITSLLSQVISNTATAVLIAPVAIALGSSLGVDPRPLLMAVAVAASTAFLTPVASPVNTLVLNPGNYRFMDFMRVGIILQVLMLLATLLVVPLFFPFNTASG